MVVQGALRTALRCDDVRMCTGLILRRAVRCPAASLELPKMLQLPRNRSLLSTRRVRRMRPAGAHPSA